MVFFSPELNLSWVNSFFLKILDSFIRCQNVWSLFWLYASSTVNTLRHKTSWLHSLLSLFLPRAPWALDPTTKTKGSGLGGSTKKHSSWPIQQLHDGQEVVSTFTLLNNFNCSFSPTQYITTNLASLSWALNFLTLYWIKIFWI